MFCDRILRTLLLLGCLEMCVGHWELQLVQSNFKLPVKKWREGTGKSALWQWQWDLLSLFFCPVTTTASELSVFDSIFPLIHSCWKNFLKFIRASHFELARLLAQNPGVNPFYSQDQILTSWHNLHSRSSAIFQKCHVLSYFHLSWVCWPSPGICFPLLVPQERLLLLQASDQHPLLETFGNHLQFQVCAWCPNITSV